MTQANLMVKFNLRKKLIRAIKLIIHCYRWCKWANDFYQKNINKFLTFVHFCEPGDFSESIDRWEHADGDAKTKAEMMDFKNIFNKKIIKKHDYNLIKKTLSNRDRTTDDLNVLRSTLKNMPHMKYFNQLIPEMQENFLKRCWIEEYQEKRVIVAQYQMPRLFYFILNGQLVCTYRNDNENKSSTICILEKGMTFGDLPISSNSMHTSSVVSITNVQLLVIEARDFVDIFLEPKSDGIANIARKSKVQESIEFLSEIEFFKNWPLQLFELKSEALKFCSFNRNQIITKDTSLSKYIYVIKKGDCSVWIKLDLDRLANENSTNIINANNKSNHDEIALNSLDASLRFFGQNQILETHHSDILYSHQNLVRAKKESKRLIDIEAKIQLNEKLAFLENYKKRDIESSAPVEADQTSDKHNYDDQLIKKAPNGTIYFYQSKLRPEVSFLPKLNPQTITSIKAKTKSKIDMKLPHLTNKNTIEKEHSKVNSVNFLQLQNLNHGDCYGLNDILFDKQPSMQIISNGCECLLISKEYFIQNSSYDYLKKLRHHVVPYPELSEIELQYVKDLEWKHFTKKIFMETLDCLRK